MSAFDYSRFDKIEDSDDEKDESLDEEPESSSHQSLEEMKENEEELFSLRSDEDTFDRNRTGAPVDLDSLENIDIEDPRNRLSIIHNQNRKHLIT